MNTLSQFKFRPADFVQDIDVRHSYQILRCLVDVESSQLMYLICSNKTGFTSVEPITFIETYFSKLA